MLPEVRMLFVLRGGSGSDRKQGMAGAEGVSDMLVILHCLI